MLGRMTLLGRDLDRRNGDENRRLCFFFSSVKLAVVSNDMRLMSLPEYMLPTSKGSSDASRLDASDSEVAYITINTVLAEQSRAWL